MWAGSLMVEVVLISACRIDWRIQIGRVGAEAGSESRVVVLGGPDQTQVAFADQVVEVEAKTQEFAGDLDDQAEVGLDQAIAGIEVALAAGLGEAAFLFSGSGARSPGSNPGTHPDQKNVVRAPSKGSES